MRARVQRFFEVDLVPAPLPGVRRLVVLGCALAAIAIDASASPIATGLLPSIQGDFALTLDEVQWAVILFNAAYWTSILTSVWMVARIGRRPFLVASLLAYALFSIVCSMAPDVPIFLAARFCQGFAQGGLFTTSAIVILTINRPDQRRSAFFALSCAVVGGALLGPLLGGWFVDESSWRWIYVAIAAASVVVAIVLQYALPHVGRHEKIPYDVVGFALVLTAFLALQYVINEGERRNWFDEPAVAYALVTFIVSFGAFVVWKLWFAAHPFLDLRILRVRLLTIGAAVALIIQLPTYTSTLLVQFLQNATHLTPTLAGETVAVRILAVLVAVPTIGMIVTCGYTTARNAFVMALVLFAGIVALSTSVFTSSTEFATFVPLALAIGFAQGMLNQPLPVLIFGSLLPSQIAMGAIIFKVAPLIGQGIATPLSQHYLNVATAWHQSDVAGMVAKVAPIPRGGDAYGLLTAQASVQAYADATVLFALLGMVALPLAFMLPSVREHNVCFVAKHVLTGIPLPPLPKLTAFHRLFGRH